MLNPGNPQTSCKDCCFAVYEDRTQTKCRLKRLDKLRRAGAEILEVFDKEKEFYVVYNKYCLWKRSPAWLEQYKDGYRRRLFKELKIKYDAIIIVGSNDNETKQDIFDSLDQLAEQSIAPNHITVVIPAYISLNIPDLKSSLDATNLNYSIEKLLEPINIERVIDIVINRHASQLYLVCESGYKLDPQLMKKVNKAVVNDVKYFGVIKAATPYHGWIFSHDVFRYYGGNYEKPLIEKIKDDGMQQLICHVDEI